MKKILALALAMMFVFALAIPAFAVDHDVQDVNIADPNANVPQFTPEQDSATVTYTMTGSYVVSIPASIPMTTPATNNVSVTSLMLGYGQKLTVSLNYSGTLKLKQNGEVKDNTLTYKLVKAGDPNNTDISSGSAQDVLVVAAGVNGFIDVSDGAKISAELTAQPKYAGIYTDTVEFTISVS